MTYSNMILIPLLGDILLDLEQLMIKYVRWCTRCNVDSLLRYVSGWKDKILLHRHCCKIVRLYTNNIFLIFLFYLHILCQYHKIYRDVQFLTI